MSKYCLQNSPVPVVVVRPGAKREKKKKKRLADPSRRSYADVMSFDGTDMAGHVLRSPLPEPAPGDEGATTGDAEREAAAVARAIGIPGPDAAINILRGGSRSGSRPSSRGPAEREEGAALRRAPEPAAESPSPTGPLSPDRSPGRGDGSPANAGERAAESEGGERGDVAGAQGRGGGGARGGGEDGSEQGYGMSVIQQKSLGGTSLLT